MANELQLAAQQSLGQLPAALRGRQGKPNEDLGAGITSGFAVVSLRGKVWRIKARGEERKLLRQDGSPEAVIDTVIVRASPHISKIFYIDGYEEGSTAPPDCWSVDGTKPDPASPKLQSATCAGCPQNAWGSASRGGKPSKGKACADSKRLAIVPSNDIKNEIYDGPMLGRVPPASLGELKSYADKLNAMGYPVEAVVTRIGFDVEAEYPSLTFTAVRALTDEEYAEVEKHREGEAVKRVLNTAIDHVQTDGDVSKLTPNQLAQQPQGNAAPQQKPQQPPAGFKPTVVQATQAAAHGADPQTGELPQATSPAAASVQRVAEVEQAQTGDPKAAQRAALRAAGLTEEQITAAIGPEPKAPEPVDPRIAALKAAGLTDAQIAAALGVTPAGNPPAASNPEPQTNGTARKRRTKAEIEADKAREEAAQKQASSGSFAPGPTEPLTGEVLPPEGAPTADSDEPAAGALPAGFENQLDALLGMKA